jgi:ketosteroid isomerase-like protein
MKEADVVAEIRALEERFIKVQEIGDGRPLNLDGIMSFYAPNCVLYDACTPLQFTGEQAIRKDVMNLFGPLQSLTIKVREMTVHGDRQLAVARSILELTAVGAKGGTSNMTCRVTDCWQRLDGRWRIIHQHASLPCDLRTGKTEFNAKDET